MEALEYAYPFRVRQYSYRKGSGGNGRHRGGDGLVREIELLAPSQVTLLADRLVRQGTLPMPQEAWYTKPRPTFTDALAAVRQHYWTQVGFRVSARRNDKLKLPKALRESLTYALCRAA